LRQPLRTARGEWAIREGFLVRVERAGGVGYGEVAPIPEFGSETIAAARAFLDRAVAEQDLPLPEGLPCCAFGLSAAGRDACPQASEQAGGRLEAAVPTKDLAVSALLPAGSAALRLASQKTALGYNSLKWKIGVEPLTEELAQARALLESLPDGVSLRLDANASLSPADLDAWLELLGRFPQQVDYLEQPLACGQETAMAEAMQRMGVPIALDESLNGPDGARWLEPGTWAGPLVVKGPLMGEVGKLLARLQPVASQVVLSSVFETGIGLINTLRLADSLPELHRPIGFDTVDAFDDALNPCKSGPILHSGYLSEVDLETLWNSI
jgi:O-succinylbenzoate synthase